MERQAWEYFILRRTTSMHGDVNYCKGDSSETVCPANVDESAVLNIFGQHGYELCSVEVQRSGDTKYYLKRRN